VFEICAPLPGHGKHGFALINPAEFPVFSYGFSEFPSQEARPDTDVEYSVAGP
jgi:hypothetical protein